MLEFIVKGLPILNFDVKAPVVLEVHIGPKGMAGVFLQRDPLEARWLPVASFSRALAQMELSRSALYLEMVAVQEALERMAHISTVACELKLRVSEGFHLLWARRAKLPAALLWRATVIESYHPVLGEP